MTEYNKNFDPPAPIANVDLRIIETGERLKGIEMLLDTGADITLLPSSSVQTLGIEPIPDETFQLEGVYGNTISAYVYYLQVIFLGKRFTGKYCLIDDNIGILGRDVLNELSIIFDGKGLEWKEYLR